MKKAKEKGVNLVLAVDAKIADSFSNDANTKFCPVDEIPDGWEGLDIGPETEKIFADVIKKDVYKRQPQNAWHHPSVHPAALLLLLRDVRHRFAL